MKVSEFKAKCLEVLKQIEADGDEVVVTRNGRPVCRITPYRTVPASLFGTLAGCVEIRGDIIAPVDEAWEAAQ